jgi:GAF domain-containing protein
MAVLLYRLIAGFVARPHETGESSLLMMLIVLRGISPVRAATKSELVIPCFNQSGQLLGVLDIDSDQPNFFTWQDAYQLDQMLRQLFQNTSS